MCLSICVTIHTYVCKYVYACVHVFMYDAEFILTVLELHEQLILCHHFLRLGLSAWAAMQ